MRIILFFLLGAFSVMGYGQSSATAIASVTILKPISINQETDMNFGEVMIGETSGTVVLFSDGSRTVDGGASFPVQSTQLPTAATFIVNGQESNYSISMPSEIFLSNGKLSLKVDNFIHTGTGSLENGAETVSIGATLHVNGSQEPGTYLSNSDLRVTVQYK